MDDSANLSIVDNDIKDANIWDDNWKLPYRPPEYRFWQLHSMSLVFACLNYY